MANIVFFMLPETGHINSSLKIAKTLKSRGHQVYYFLIREFEDYIRDQGLGFIPFFEDIFPKGCHFSHNLSTAENILPCIMAEADARGVDGLTLLKSEIRGQLERF